MNYAQLYFILKVEYKVCLKVLIVFVCLGVSSNPLQPILLHVMQYVYMFSVVRTLISHSWIGL